MSEFHSTLQNASIACTRNVLTHRKYSAPTLSYHKCLPHEAKAMVVVLHGYGEHSQRYQRVMELWAAENIASFAIDFRGHGLSSGRRGHCAQFTDYFDDANALLEEVKLYKTHVPIFLFGHSFGGLVATLWAMQHPNVFRGLIVSSPFFGLQLEVNPLKKVVGQIASRLIPWLSLPSGLKGSDVTRDPEIAKLYDTDPLINKNATARWFTETMAAQDQLLLRASSIQLPVLVVQGSADRVANAAKTRTIFDRFRSTDKTFDERVGCFHEVLNEPDVWKEIALSMAQWMLKHST